MFNRCEIIRWKLSRAFNREEDLSGQLQKHVDGCESCRHFYRVNRSLLPHPGEVRRPERSEVRRAEIMAAVRAEARKKPDSDRLIRERAKRIGPLVAGAAAVFLMVIWLSFEDPMENARSKGSSFSGLPGTVSRAAQSQYKSEMAKLQRDLSRSSLFVRAAAIPMRGLDRE
jgi:hypothetical protein